MKTTIDIPDPLFRRAKIASAERGITFKQLFVEGLEKALEEPPASVPLARPKPVELTPEMAEIYELDGLGVPVLKKRPVPPPEEFLAIIESIREEEGI